MGGEFAGNFSSEEITSSRADYAVYLKKIRNIHAIRMISSSKKCLYRPLS